MLPTETSIFIAVKEVKVLKYIINNTNVIKILKCCLTLEGSWPAGHCRHAHPFPHRDCTAAVPPQPNSWKTQKRTRESEEVRTRVDTLFFLHNRAHKACAYLPRGGQ